MNNNKKYLQIVGITLEETYKIWWCDEQGVYNQVVW